MTQLNKHKHADLIIQWALGHEIEVMTTLGQWATAHNPYWDDKAEYRIKKKVKQNIVGYANIDESITEDSIDGSICGRFSTTRLGTDNLKVTYSGETGKLLSIEIIEQDLI